MFALLEKLVTAILEPVVKRLGNDLLMENENDHFSALIADDRRNLKIHNFDWQIHSTEFLQYCRDKTNSSSVSRVLSALEKVPGPVLRQVFRGDAFEVKDSPVFKEMEDVGILRIDRNDGENVTGWGFILFLLAASLSLLV